MAQNNCSMANRHCIWSASWSRCGFQVSLFVCLDDAFLIKEEEEEKEVEALPFTLCLNSLESEVVREGSRR